CGVFFAVLGLGAILWPSPLLVKGNLLQIPDLILYDGFFQFWLPWVSQSPKGTFYIFLLSFIFLILSPIWLKPSKKNQPGKAYNDPKLCQGCTQCVQDCPYEAISMIPRPEGEGSPLVAYTSDNLCVSCGLCGASCDPFTMGMDGRRGIDLLRTARELVRQLKEQGTRPEDQYAVIGCMNQAAVMKRLENWSEIKKNVQIISLECAGSAHPAAIEFLSRAFKHVIISACPERNCENKDGFMLLNERLTGKREPTFTKYFDPKKMSLVAAGDGEENRIFETIERLHTEGKTEGLLQKTSKLTQYLKPVRAVLGGLAIVYFIFNVSHLSMKSDMQSAILRLSWRLTGQFIQTCQTRTQEELMKLPAHMRTPELCERKPVSFKLLLYVDNELIIDKIVQPGGFRHDRPIYVEHDIDLPAGLHQVKVSFLPIEKEATEATRLELSSDIMIPKREIALIYIEPDKKELSIKTSEAK
ncbi:MAG: hydrogenase iron-sulfur subunit, partial [Bdellovibrionales bacterium]|nr:hydrogenase iron-sulfur subunit [Bdellovibrionales bacterium]